MRVGCVYLRARLEIDYVLLLIAMNCVSRAYLAKHYVSSLLQICLDQSEYFNVFLFLGDFILQ